jgi:hypothetical protein
MIAQLQQSFAEDGGSALDYLARFCLLDDYKLRLYKLVCGYFVPCQLTSRASLHAVPIYILCQLTRRASLHAVPAHTPYQRSLRVLFELSVPCQFLVQARTRVPSRTHFLSRTCFPSFTNFQSCNAFFQSHACSNSVRIVSLGPHVSPAALFSLHSRVQHPFSVCIHESGTPFQSATTFQSDISHLSLRLLSWRMLDSWHIVMIVL